jgi:vesicular inhibitory amino acid transporter
LVLLFISLLKGHAVFPTVYRDMENPKDYRRMVNWTYVVTTIVYFLVAFCGYFMFGSKTMHEVKWNVV